MSQGVCGFTTSQYHQRGCSNVLSRRAVMAQRHGSEAGLRTEVCVPT